MRFAWLLQHHQINDKIWGVRKDGTEVGSVMSLCILFHKQKDSIFIFKELKPWCWWRRRRGRSLSERCRTGLDHKPGSLQPCRERPGTGWGHRGAGPPSPPVYPPGGRWRSWRSPGGWRTWRPGGHSKPAVLCGRQHHHSQCWSSGWSSAGQETRWSSQPSPVTNISFPVWPHFTREVSSYVVSLGCRRSRLEVDLHQVVVRPEVQLEPGQLLLPRLADLLLARLDGEQFVVEVQSFAGPSTAGCVRRVNVGQHAGGTNYIENLTLTLMFSYNHLLQPWSLRQSVRFMST